MGLAISQRWGAFTPKCLSQYMLVSQLSKREREREQSRAESPSALSRERGRERERERERMYELAIISLGIVTVGSRRYIHIYIDNGIGFSWPREVCHTHTHTERERERERGIVGLQSHCGLFLDEESLFR